MKTTCLSAALLARMAEGGLERTEREAAVRHLARCPACGETLAVATRFAEASGSAEKSGGSKWWPSGLAAAALICALAWMDRPSIAPRERAPEQLSPLPIWVETARWRTPDAAAGFAPESIARSAFRVGLHLGTLDVACVRSDAEQLARVRLEVAAGLERSGHSTWARRVEASGCPMTDSEEFGGLQPRRWRELGRIAESWRAATVTRDSSLLSVRTTERADRLLRELPLEPPASDALRRAVEAVHAGGGPDWTGLVAALDDLAATVR